MINIEDIKNIYENTRSNNKKDIKSLVDNFDKLTKEKQEIELPKLLNYNNMFLLIHHLEINQNKDLIKNNIHKITSLTSLIQLYVFFYDNQEIKNELNKKILPLLKLGREELNKELIDFLFIYLIDNQLNFNEYYTLLSDTHNSIDIEIDFKEEVFYEDFIKTKIFQNKQNNFVIRFNLKELYEKNKEYFTINSFIYLLNKSESSANQYDNSNKKTVFYLCKFENVNINKIFKENNLSVLNLIGVTKNHTSYSNQEDFGIDLYDNTVMTFEEKLELLDELFFFTDKSNRSNYIVDLEKFYFYDNKKVFEYKNIRNFIFKNLVEFYNSRTFIDTRNNLGIEKNLSEIVEYIGFDFFYKENKKKDNIILSSLSNIELYNINDKCFIKNLLEYIKEEKSNIIDFVSLLTMINYIEDKKTIIKIIETAIGDFNILINLFTNYRNHKSKEKILFYICNDRKTVSNNRDYEETVAHNFISFLHYNLNIVNIVIEYLLKTNDLDTILNFINNNVRIALKNNLIIKYIRENKKLLELILSRKSNVYYTDMLNFLFKNEFISERFLFEEIKYLLSIKSSNLMNLEVYLVSLLSEENKKNIFKYLSIDSKLKVYNENLKSRFSTNELKEEDIKKSISLNYEFYDFIIENNKELLSNKDFVSNLLRNNNIGKIFLEIIEYKKEITLVRTLIELSDYYLIDLDKNVKDEFYYLFTEKIEDIFDI